MRWKVISHKNTRNRRAKIHEQSIDVPLELVKSMAKHRSISQPLSTYCLNRGRVICGVSSIIGGSRISHGALAKESFKSLDTDTFRLCADIGGILLVLKLPEDLGALFKSFPNKLLVDTGGSGSLGSTISAFVTRIVPICFPLLIRVRTKSISDIWSSTPSSSFKQAFISISTVVSHTPNNVSACPCL